MIAGVIDFHDVLRLLRAIMTCSIANPQIQTCIVSDSLNFARKKTLLKHQIYVGLKVLDCLRKTCGVVLGAWI